MSILVDAVDLKRLHTGGRPLTILDVRWKLGDPHGRQHYLDGHIPGAVYVDLETELAAPPDKASGRHPLPHLDALQAAARRWGIRADHNVVAYDDVGSMSAARAWWLLRWAGVSSVRLLDGGLNAWIAAGYDVETGPADVPGGDVVLSSGQGMPTVDAESAAQLGRDGVLLDARAAERYRGEIEPVDPRAGHIPGAVSAPTSQNLDDAGRFLPAEALRDRFQRMGVATGKPIGAYCGSGVTAAHEVAALTIAGFDAALYPGSWSQWSADLSRPVAVGPGPGGDVNEETSP